MRYIVAWDWLQTGQQAEVAAYMDAARAHGQDVLVTFTVHRGCFDGAGYSRVPACRAPSASAYRASVRAFDDSYPWVRTYSAWNEVNHVSQPTFGRPQLAARYYSVLLRESRRRHFRVMAADVLDTSNMGSYLRAFMRLAPGRAAPVGAAQLPGRQPRHVRRHSRDARNRAGRGSADGDRRDRQVGNSRQFAYSGARAANRTRWMFGLAARFISHPRGLRSTLTRLYVYKWFGAPPGARFDAGLVGFDGTPRPAFYVVRRHARSHR